MEGYTFGEYIETCVANRGGDLNPMDYYNICMMIPINLKSKGGCVKCIKNFEKKRDNLK